jgi:hypothetical protein
MDNFAFKDYLTLFVLDSRQKRLGVCKAIGSSPKYYNVVKFLLLLYPTIKG